jgi:hypothetical protein
MTRSRILDVVAVNLAVAAGVVFVHDYMKRSQVIARPEPRTIMISGPRPNGTLFESHGQLRAQTLKGLRAWFQRLGPQDVEALRREGQVTFPYEELERSHPAQAALLKAYLEDMAARIARKLRGADARVQLLPESLSFEQQCDLSGAPAPGRYTCRIKFHRLESRPREFAAVLRCEPGACGPSD